MIEKDDFEEWLCHPITESLMAMLDREAKKVERIWLDVSLGTGRADPVELAMFRERIKLCREIRQITPETLEEE